MSLFDGVKGKLGFGNKSDWQDDGYNDQGGQGYDDYQDDGYDDGYDDQEYLDGPIDDDYVDEPAGDVVSFDAYNPDKFENVKLGDRTPRVASYDSLGATSTSGRSYASTSGSGYASGATSNVRPLGPSTDRGYGASSSSAGSWRSSGDSGYGKQSTAERSRQIMDEISAQAAGAGIVMPAVLMGGTVAGRWKRTGRALNIEWFGGAPAADRAAARDEAARLWDDLTAIKETDI